MAPFLLGVPGASRVRARERRAVQAWLFAPWSWYGLGGVATGTAGARTSDGDMRLRSLIRKVDDGERTSGRLLCL